MYEVFVFGHFPKVRINGQSDESGGKWHTKSPFLWVQNKNHHLKTLFFVSSVSFLYILSWFVVFFSSTSFGDLVETETSQRTKFRSVISMTTTILYFIWMMYVSTIACRVLWMHFAHFLFHRRPTTLRMKREWSTLTHSKLYFLMLSTVIYSRNLILRSVGKPYLNWKKVILLVVNFSKFYGKSQNAILLL